MKRFVFPPLIGLLVIGGLLAAVAGSPEVTPEGDASKALAVKIDDSRCYVGIAAVNLVVSELKAIDGEFVATYSITVPLRKSNNDTGLITLPIDTTINELSLSGGVLEGTARSDKPAATPNKLICQVLPQEDQGILLEITTQDNVLEFVSRFTVVESEAGD